MGWLIKETGSDPALFIEVTNQGFFEWTESQTQALQMERQQDASDLALVIDEPTTVIQA